MLAAAFRNPTFAGVMEDGRVEKDPERAIDLVHLARQTDGDDALEAELLVMFDRQAEKLVERVKIAELPHRARADLAHRLKGSALAIGAFAVARAAGGLEEAFDHEGVEPETEIAALVKAVAAARGAIARLMS
jgi:HPt (histidine-containing phosphotransfer) domain-containing protein